MSISVSSSFGDGKTTIADLIAAQSRRRAAATGGESKIPVDAETRRTLSAAGYALALRGGASEIVLVDIA